jgi:hypothetical protein
MPWVSASRPVVAASQPGMVVRVSGSVMEMSGTNARPSRVTFTRRATSLMIANWERSAPVPAVVGAATSGGSGWVTLSMPS